jgi:hypothetical protein
MRYSYTQIAQYLRCPKLYRYRYLDGWREKELRASMQFGICFEIAISGYFLDQDCTSVFFTEWSKYRDASLTYARDESWDKLYRQGIQLLERFAQDDRVKIAAPHDNLQREVVRQMAGGNEFVSYVDAIANVSGVETIIDWKTTTRRYPEQPTGLLSLDPQLICYSWMTGIRQVGVVVFLRKTVPEIQYLVTSISEEQCRLYSQVVNRAISLIEAGEFPPHSGIRFPQDGCVSCSHLGLCLGKPELIESTLSRKIGAEAFDWIEQLVD